MKKFILYFGALFCILTQNIQAQTTATDFTVKDCNNKEHSLFSVLNEGKVVVMVWVMPCGSCIGPAKTAYNVSLSFASSHPEKVIYYLIDDEANTNCTALTNWATGNAIYPASTFSNSAISMNDYGSFGMPKIVILGTEDHVIFFNKNYTDAANPTEIQNAINNALAATVDVEELSDFAENINVFPNPAIAKTLVTYVNKTYSDVNIEVYNFQGQLLKSERIENQTAGKQEYELDVTSFANGIYCIKINGDVLKLTVQN